jgi:plastocyanin
LKRLLSLVAFLFVVVMLGVVQQNAAKAFQGETVTISMKDFDFDPQKVTIKAGSSVVWQNVGAKKHTATADDASFNTDVVAAGASSQPLKFDKAGTFAYFCEFHGGAGGIDMAGTITVVDAAPPVEQPATAPTAAPVGNTASSAAEPVGSATFADKGKDARANSVTINLTNLPLPEEGKQYAAWLANPTKTLSLGKVNLKADGTAVVEFTDPKGQNLIDLYNTVLISEQGAQLTPPGPIVYSGNIPPQSYVHVKHVVTQFPDTPDKVGLLVGALEEEAVLTDHVKFLNEAIQAGNVGLAKKHLEHIHNIMTGNDGAKDLDGDGKLTVVPPGDGFGIFNYLVTAAQHADLAAKQGDASDNIKVKANHIKITVGNASTTLTQIQTLVVQAAAVKTGKEMKPIADQITKLNEAVVKGVPDASGGVSPTKGSGGLGTAYAAGLGLATISIVPGDVTGGKGAATGAEAPAEQPTTAAAPADANATTIIMKDFEFDQKTVTIPVGGSVIFTNQGAKKHTGTADDSAFDTGVVAAGASSQPLKFDKAGTFAYFCQFHGGPGGTAMAGVIIVQ